MILEKQISLKEALRVNRDKIKKLLRTLREDYPYSKLFWSAFYGIWTAYGEVSLHIQSECGKMRTKITPNANTFCAVRRSLYFSSFPQLFSIFLLRGDL